MLKAKTILVMVGMAACIAACTVTPKVVTNGQASFDGNEQNSGIIGLDATDCAIVTQHYRDRYNGLVQQFGLKFSPVLIPDEGFVPTGTNTFLVDRQHRFYFNTMNRWRKEGKPPWAQ